MSLYLVIAFAILGFGLLFMKHENVRELGKALLWTSLLVIMWVLVNTKILHIG